MPIFSAHPSCKLAIISQAPGLQIHHRGLPWDDKSGQNLRNWLGLDVEDFCDPKKVAIVPMGFCYPGKGKSGDLPPRKECAPLWHRRLLGKMPNVELTLLIGKHAQDYYLPQAKHLTLTKRVKHFRDYLPQYFVLPHPSPRNNIWQAKNKWFVEEVIPELQRSVKNLFSI
ncbi:MAG: uracil-DNA glycosylase family protein [Bacteroidota bacterium]